MTHTKKIKNKLPKVKHSIYIKEEKKYFTKKQRRGIKRIRRSPNKNILWRLVDKFNSV